MAVLVQTLIDQTRLLSNLKNNPFYSDDDIGGFINDAAMELDDIFTDSVEHYSSKVLDFTLAGGVSGNSVSLPTDFMKEQLVLKDPTTASPQQVPMLANLAERGSMGDGVMSPGLGRCFYIGGDVLEILPAPTSAGNYRLMYTPQLGNIWTNTPVTDALPARLVPWQLFLKVHAAIAICQGRKQPTADLQLKLDQQHERAVKMSKNRTEGVTQAPLQRPRRTWWYDLP